MKIKKFKMKLKLILVLLLKINLFVLLIVIASVLINNELNKKIFITKYQIKSEKVSHMFDNYKILQLADIHSIRTQKQKINLLEKVKRENPDIIVITGDLIDSNYYLQENEKYLKKEIGMPDKITLEFTFELTEICDVYYIYGNHEMILLDNPKNNIFKLKLEELGVKILNNEIEKIKIDGEEINIVGIQDPSTLYKDEKYATIGKNNKERTKEILNDLLNKRNLEKNNYTILLSHRPEYFDLYSKYAIDLAFTGHAHGGIIRLPFLGGLYAHPQGWFPKYTSGIHTSNNFNMIVSRGIGNSNSSFRIFNPPEIVVVNLKHI